MDAVQVSQENEDTLETKKFRIKLYAGKISKDGKDILAGTRLEESDLKGLRVQFNTFNPKEDQDDFITRYKGGYDIHVYVFPVVNIRIPVIENPLYTPEKEKTLLSCIDDLIKNKEYRDLHEGKIFPEQVQKVG